MNRDDFMINVNFIAMKENAVHTTAASRRYFMGHLRSEFTGASGGMMVTQPFEKSQRNVLDAEDRINPSLLPAMLNHEHMQMPIRPFANGATAVNEHECLTVTDQLTRQAFGF
jgi:hypothetical protein